MIQALSFSITSNLRPSYTFLEKQYEKYKQNKDTQPCKYGYKNQCAIRLSLALANCGMTFELFQNQKRIHKGRKECQLSDTPHIVGAEELMLFLQQVWDAGISDKGSLMKTAIQNKRGIIYFNNCFKREKSDTSFKGDHIDLWTGSEYYNQIFKVGAGGDAKAGTDLFSRADSVRFFWLPE